MARKLKTYVASIGFFEVAVAAPSMKAAAEAWGSGNNLFKWGLAKETSEAAIVKAAMAKPGIVVKRPVGSSDAFKERGELRQILSAERARTSPGGSEERRPPDRSRRAVRDTAAGAAAAALAREQKQYERRRRAEE